MNNSSVCVFTASELEFEWAGPGKAASGVLHILAFTALLFNFLALLSYREVQKPTVLFLRNLAVADVITAVAFLPAYWIPPYYLMERCSDWYGCVYFMVNAAVLSITAFSFTGVVGLVLNQTIAVVSPFRYRGLWSHAKRIICIVILWILPPLFTLLTITYGFVLHRNTNSSEAFCTFISSPKVKRFGKILWVVAASIALSVVIGMYVKVYFVARRVIDGRFLEQKREMQRNVRAVKTTALLLACLLLCWVPIVVCTAVRTYRLTRASHSLVIAMFWTWTLVNSIADPVIVMLRMKQVRRGYKRLCPCVRKCQKRQRPSDQPTLMTQLSRVQLQISPP